MQIRSLLALAAASLVVSCGDDDDDQADVDGSTPGEDAEVPTDGGGPPDVDAAPPVGQLGEIVRIDHLGWRPSDRKVAVLLGNAGASVELRDAITGAVVTTLTSGAATTDDDSGDEVSLVDFTTQQTPGDYYLYVPSLEVRSYRFRIAEDVYDIVGAAAVKSFYFQRCNHDRVAPFAGDALGGYAGIGGEWLDGTCHAGDFAAPPGPGSADHGPLDVHGGWHDAGDYQKTLWGRGVPEMLFAYEVNPGAWTDGQLEIPESGNGIPDLLDELRWELDFYVRVQRPDGHFMSSVKGRGPDEGGVNSPPSASNEGRVYFDGTSPSGDGWSGGGVTVAAATGNAVLSLAHAAIVFGAVGETEIADGYRAAARSGWQWLSGQDLGGSENRVKAAAASAVFRMDPEEASARAFVEAFDFAGWDGMLPWDATPAESVVATAAWHYLMNPSGSDGLDATIAEAVRQAILEPAFEEEGAYGGMRGGSGDGWDYSWGSNRQQSTYGANVLMALHLGVQGGHDAADVAALGQKHLHYLLGGNPLGMVYLTNMAAYGGEHSSFQLYHGWFSYTGGDGDHGNADYNGKPAGVDEPLYPYHPDDAQTSMYGPAPGLLVGGPNYYYSCSYDLPNRERPAYAYRDFSVGCDWDDAAFTCRACSWEITEPMAAYQGPFVLLVSFLMAP